MAEDGGSNSHEGLDRRQAEVALVRSLERLGLHELRSVWQERYGAPPRFRAPDLLRRMLAWRIQVELHGKIDPALRKALRDGAASRGPILTPGAKVVREFCGVRHEVEVTDGGFQYEGRLYPSLSAIARKITGVRWNGPRFFGLRASST